MREVSIPWTGVLQEARRVCNRKAYAAIADRRDRCSRGSGSAVLLLALERNAHEGYEGQLLAFDIREDVGAGKAIVRAIDPTSFGDTKTEPGPRSDLRSPPASLARVRRHRSMGRPTFAPPRSYGSTGPPATTGRRSDQTTARTPRARPR